MIMGFDKKVITGISYGSAICEYKNILDLIDQQISLIEIPFGEDECFYKIIEFVKNSNMRYSLHVPSYQMIKALPFILDTRTFMQVEQYVQFVSDFLDKQSSLDFQPEYIVAHFPLISKEKDLIVRRDLNRYFLSQISNCIRTHQISLFVENIAVDHMFFCGKDYKKILPLVDGICYDIGHSHTAEFILNTPIKYDLIDEMFTELFEQIRCIHLYNTVKNPNNGYYPQIHYPFGIFTSFQSNFMNENILMMSINKLPNLKYIVYEPHRSQALKYGSFGCIW